MNNLDPVVVVVQQEDAASSHLLCLHHGLQVSQKAHVLGHVGGEHLGRADTVAATQLSSQLANSFDPQIAQ